MSGDRQWENNTKVGKNREHSKDGNRNKMGLFFTALRLCLAAQKALRKADIGNKIFFYFCSIARYHSTFMKQAGLGMASDMAYSSCNIYIIANSLV